MNPAISLFNRTFRVKASLEKFMEHITGAVERLVLVFEASVENYIENIVSS